jgi:hypothetical protein
VLKSGTSQHQKVLLRNCQSSGVGIIGSFWRIDSILSRGEKGIEYRSKKMEFPKLEA